MTRDCCHRCRDERLADAPTFERLCVTMLLCPTCGNKRCPRANDHDNACTGSNEPGQPGSAYAALPGCFNPWHNATWCLCPVEPFRPSVTWGDSLAHDPKEAAMFGPTA